MRYPKIKDFRDFIDNADEIKEMYGGILSKKFNYEYAIKWRFYIYTRTNISLKFRNYIWEYINDDISKIELLSIYLESLKKQ